MIVWRIVERMSLRQCHGVRSARNSRDVCIWDGERKDSRRLVSNFAQDIEIAAWNVPHVFSVSKEAVSLRLRPALSRARDRSGLVFGFRSFIFRSSGTAFDSAGREKRLVVILLQWQSFRDFIPAQKWVEETFVARYIGILYRKPSPRDGWKKKKKFSIRQV